MSVEQRTRNMPPRTRVPRRHKTIQLHIEELESRVAPSGVAPTLNISAPVDYDLRATGQTYTISFTASDPDSPATIELYYDADKNPNNGRTLIAAGLSKDLTSYNWNTTSVRPGLYYIYGRIHDGQNLTEAWSTGRVVLSAPYGPPVATFNTSLGSFTVELNQNAAPITVANFRTYADAGAYNGLVFHRVMSNFMIQGGGYYPDLTTHVTTNPSIVNENLRGAIAMARTPDPNSATSEFFINVVDNSFLDYANLYSPGYAVFGRVLTGANVVNAIRTVPVQDNGYGEISRPLNPPVIYSVSITDSTTPTTVTILASDPFAAETGPDPGVFTVTRSGDTTGALIVGYTIGGTATPGADYGALSGSLALAVGQTSATIVVTPVPDSLVEGNETVVLTLSPSASYALGYPSTATVTIADSVIGTTLPTIGNSSLVKTVIYTDTDGTLVTFNIQGGDASLRFLGNGVTWGSAKVGTIQIRDDDNRVELADVTLSNIQPTCKITITTQGGLDAGARLQAIFGDGPVASITAPGVDFIGRGIVMDFGSVASLQVRDILFGAGILMSGPGPATGVMIKARDIAANANVALTPGIKSFIAARWASGTLTAPWAAALSITGDNLGIVGDFGATVNLSGVGAPAGKPTLAGFSASGAAGGYIAVTGAIGAFNAGELSGAQIIATAGIGPIKILKGGLNASITAGDGIASINIVGGTGGNLSGVVIANGPAGIGTINVPKGGLNGATISAAHSAGAGIKSVIVNGGIVNSAIVSQGTGGIGKMVVKGDADMNLAVPNGIIGSFTLTGTSASKMSGTWNVLGIKTFKGTLGEMANFRLTASGAIGSFTAGGNMTGNSTIKALALGTLTIQGELRSDNAYAIETTGDLGAKSKITVAGTASYGLNQGVNRIKIGGALHGQISVGTSSAVLNGMFGDVVIVNSLNSTGKLTADARNPNAVIFAANPDNLTYTAGKVTGKTPAILFGLSSWPEA